MEEFKEKWIDVTGLNCRFDKNVKFMVCKIFPQKEDVKVEVVNASPTKKVMGDIKKHGFAFDFARKGIICVKEGIYLTCLPEEFWEIWKEMKQIFLL